MLKDEVYKLKGSIQDVMSSVSQAELRRAINVFVRCDVFKSGDQKPNINSNTFNQKAWTPTHGKVKQRLA
jgi:hypothetical protein